METISVLTELEFKNKFTACVIGSEAYGEIERNDYVMVDFGDYKQQYKVVSTRLSLLRLLDDDEIQSFKIKRVKSYGDLVEMITEVHQMPDLDQLVTLLSLEEN